MAPRCLPTTQETRRSMVISLKEWGIDYNKNGAHDEFHRNAIQAALALVEECAQSESGEQEISDESGKIPRNLNKAIKYVFRSEMVLYRSNEAKLWWRQSGNKLRKRGVCIVDTLENHSKDKNKCEDFVFFSEPFYVKQDDQTGKDTVRRRRHFTKFRIEGLDPLKRFVKETIQDTNPTPAQLAFDYFLDDQGTVLGHAFEAIVASHAIHYEKCYHCKSHNSLKWSGGSDTAWEDLYCARCHSCFEIKSLANKDKIDRVFEFGGATPTYKGGSFSRWCQGAGRFQNREGKDYIAFVSRSERMIRDGTVVWSVDICEIKVVTPRLKCNSFINYQSAKKKRNDDWIRLTSLVHMVPNSRRLWFNVPKHGHMTIGFDVLGGQVFEELFPNQLDACRAEQQQTNKSPGLTSKEKKILAKEKEEAKMARRAERLAKEAEERAKREEEEKLQKIRQELESLAVNEEDDWENCYDTE